MATPPDGFWETLSPEQRRAALDYRGPENTGPDNVFKRAVESDPFPVESIVRIGPYVEKLTLDRSTLTVSYSGPPMPQELQARLAQFWAARIEALTWRLMGLSPPAEETPFTGLPEAPARPARKPVGRGPLSGCPT